MGSLFSPPKITIDPPAAPVTPTPAAVPQAVESVGLEDLAALRQALVRKRASRSSLIIDPATGLGTGTGVGV